MCSGNAYRSSVAEALLKKLKPEVLVDSAGTDPASLISEAAKRYLTRESAQKYLKKVPEGLNEKRLEKYDLIVAMKPKHRDFVTTKCPECRNKIVVWNIDDPYFLPHGYAEEIFKQIKRKVTELANTL